MNVEEIIERELLSIPGWCSIEKGKRMAALARGASLCVELGVFGGRGIICMALPLAAQRFGRVDGIDPFTSTASLEGTNAAANDAWWAHLDYESIAQEAQTTIYRLGLVAHAHLIRMCSREVADYYDFGTIDCLHLDANHSEETSCEDVMLWAPKIRSGGYWIFDDTNWETTKRAQRELAARGFAELEDHDSWKVYRCY